MKDAATSCTISPRTKKIHAESSFDYLVVAMKIIAIYAYPTGAMGHFYRENPLKLAPQLPQRANQALQGGEQCAHGRRAYSRMLQRRVRQPSLSRKPRQRATNTPARVNRRTCARCSPPRLPSQPVCSFSLSTLPSLIRGGIHCMPVTPSNRQTKAKPLTLRPLNQKPHAPHAIPLVRIQPEREDDARG